MQRLLFLHHGETEISGSAHKEVDRYPGSLGDVCQCGIGEEGNREEAEIDIEMMFALSMERRIFDR